MVDTLTTTGQVLVVSRLTVNGMHTQVLTVNMIVCHCMHTQINTQVGKTKTHCKFLKPKKNLNIIPNTPFCMIL